MRNHRNRVRFCWAALLVLMAVLGSGCGTMENGAKWGRDAIYPVQWARIPRAAGRALLDPATWVPAAGAAVFAIDDFDPKTVRWASEHNPVFGSKATAGDVSDYLRTALTVESYGTILLTPSGDQAGEWLFSKSKGLLVEGAAHAANGYVTGLGKDWVGRTRPDGSSDKSMPSGHATAAFGAARLANRNLDAIQLRPWLRTTFQAGNFAMAGATAWGRVEAERHYPSDVLVGAAVGNFITSFIHDALLNLPEDTPRRFRLDASPSRFVVGWSWSF